ncbi:hypothetical protein, conserved [Eimeria tenella]|uniref:Uncharacterized protein n=1 Tax=Eimeria tenella TaxID=5802 RepID=U6KXW7_EIMTE|nr:hypothetical protein, conserved [Eimeria tenella]CDJ42816.1 hypothetical protein, conserved [Eimeria tenella]|eukprot:XP_013233566.1 hypothetical protein, conserved [Eimeria tenella]
MRWLRGAQRELLLRGSPAFRVGVWVAGVGGALLWIYFEEINKPLKERVLFLPAKRQIPMEAAEIEAWNLGLSGGKLLHCSSSEQQQQHGVEAARAKALEAIKQQEAAEKDKQQQQQQQQTWLSSFLGLGNNTENAKPKKVSFFSDK